MDDQTTPSTSEIQKVIPFPGPFKPVVVPAEGTPQYDKIVELASKLDKVSTYKSEFDYTAYKRIEERYQNKPIRGGVTLKTAFRLVNSHSTCQQCLYSFEIDTYGRGCVHNCSYCYAKAQLTVHGWWNNPIPVPADLNEIRKAFHYTFETDKPHKWRKILERKIPLRIGSMSDSFMWIDQKIKITQELLKLLKHYKYPYVIFTRSDLVATDEYLKLLDPSIGSVQFSISSTNDEMNRQIEPGAPSAKRRLKALKVLSENKIWTAVRINPLFPIYPDGYFTDPNFKWKGEVPRFNYSSFEMVDEIAAHNVPSIIAGFGRFSRLSLNAVERSTNFNLRQFYRRNQVDKSWRDFHYSDAEVRYYYEQIKKKCVAHAIEFTTCYIGNGETHFWKDQDLWNNKKDCCGIKDRVAGFGKDSREIPFDQRLLFTAQKAAKPVSENLHKPLGNDQKIKRKSVDKKTELEL